MGYDESRPFFEQLIELRKKSIFVALESLHPSNVNTKYTNNASYQKNCFMTIYADYDEHCAYTMLTAHNKDLLDSFRPKNNEVSTEGKRTTFRSGISGKIFGRFIFSSGIISSLSEALLSGKK
jgi:hypothetical protein